MSVQYNYYGIGSPKAKKYRCEKEIMMMKYLSYKVFGRVLAILMMSVALLGGLTSCSAVYDDLEECPRGVTMRFIFDYNLEFANAFPSQVDCLSVYIFDAEGKLVERRVETSEVLADEDWRMTVDLPAGDYRAVAYGGMECELSSFNHTTPGHEVRTLEDLEVLINDSHIGDADNAPAAPLHDLFHGALDFTVHEGTDYENVTVAMMRNTNHLRLVLQHIDNSPVDYKDFKFEVIDDNVRFTHSNDVVPHRVVTYTPWSAGNSYAGMAGNPDAEGKPALAADEGLPVQVAYAEISMSRLMYDSSHVWTKADGETRTGPRLRITNVNDGHTVADLPLNNYLLLMKSDYFNKMDNQEYLDRAYRHNMVFFLDSETESWVRLNIVVGPWTVRVDNLEF